MVGPTGSAHFSTGLHIPASGANSAAPARGAENTPHLVERFSSHTGQSFDTGRALAAAQHAPVQAKIDLQNLADYSAGRTQRPPAGWRAAGTADLSTLAIRAENLSSLSGNQFARVFVTSAKGEGRVAIALQNNPGAQQQWLKDGGAKFGPSLSEQAEVQNLAQTIRANGQHDVTVISADNVADSSAKSVEHNQNGLIWTGIPGPLIAYAQSMGRQAEL